MMWSHSPGLSESLGDESKWVHYGLTSTDVVDTAYGYLMKQANDLIRKDLETFTAIIGEKAIEHKYTVIMGRTHGVHAEPTTFGLKLALWYSEMKRNIERFERAAAGVEAGKISGAVRTCPTFRHLLKNMYVTSWGFVLKKSLRKYCREISMQNILLPWH